MCLFRQVCNPADNQCVHNTQSPVYTHEIIQEPLDGFPCNLLLENFMKNTQATSIFTQIGQF
jgi:hypothetical protein